MFLYRLAPEGFYAVRGGDGVARILYSDPYRTPISAWEYGRRVDLEAEGTLVPVAPGKVVGIGRNYRDHAAELGNPMPAEPLIFLKATSSVIGPNVPVVLPPESSRVEFEGEIAIVLGRRLTRADRHDARAGILGITAANDVTARDLQKKDATFARGKGFDSFCPVGPAVWIGADLDDLEVVTRVNGEERQHGHVRDMAWGLVELVAYVSRFMTLEPGDLLLTGTPAGVGQLSAGDTVEVEIPGLGMLANPVETLVG
ncbi:MAG: fumarylacetoacetate hydrolase family protein [Thermoanaerobaculia bacterium]|nr:fumarylacetoacetate hydrolase family protein [Thermoanaerobaculia bacterium]